MLACSSLRDHEISTGASPGVTQWRFPHRSHWPELVTWLDLAAGRLGNRNEIIGFGSDQSWPITLRLGTLPP